jgi:hypothetical protein
MLIMAGVLSLLNKAGVVFLYLAEVLLGAGTNRRLCACIVIRRMLRRRGELVLERVVC